MRSKTVFFLLIIILLLNLAVSSTSAIPDNRYEDWQYYKEITIKENSGKTLRDYPVLVEIKPFDFMDVAEVDGSDLRFSDGESELSYWIEGYNRSGMTAKIWVNVPRIPSYGETTIFMYYGNEKASKASDGEATFQFFDGFGGDELDEGKWNLIEGGKTTVDVSDGELNIEGRCFKCETDSGLVKVVTDESFNPPYVLEFKTSISHSQRDRGRGAYFGFSDDNTFASPTSVGENYALFRLSEKLGSFSEFPMVSEFITASEGVSKETERASDFYYRDAYNIYSVAVTNGYAEHSVNYKDEVSHTTNVPKSAMYGVMALQAWDEDYGQFFIMYSHTDWFRIRKYAHPEPTATIGAENENLNQEFVTNYINFVSEGIDNSRSLGVDVTLAESKLKDAREALNLSDYKGAKGLADDALEYINSSTIKLDSINDLKDSSSRYDGYTVEVSGDIRGIETVGDQGYKFILDDSTDLISVVFTGSLADITDGDKVTIRGKYHESSGMIEADTVEKSGFGSPGYEAVFTITALLAVAYIIRISRTKIK